jgi:hypothetical protein
LTKAQDLANWINEQHEEQKQTQWKQTGPEMINRTQQRTKRNEKKRDKEKRSSNNQPFTDKLFQSHSFTNYQSRTTTTMPILLQKTSYGHKKKPNQKGKQNLHHMYSMKRRKEENGETHQIKF